jgi:3-oxoadipate enol-lactonase
MLIYHETGEGFPLILIHGVGLDHAIWELQVAQFSQYYRVITYDMIGHGEADKPQEEYTLSQFVDQLEQVFQALELQQAHIVGLSMGGLVAQSFAAQHPDKVAALIIVSSVAKRTEEQRNAVWGRVSQVEQSGHTSTIDAAIQRWFDETFQLLHPKTVQTIRERLVSNEPAAYLAAYKVFASADEETYPKLQQIACPTLIITGELDKGSTPEMAKLMAEAIPNAKAVILPNIKHMLPIEAADAFNALALAFFGENARKESAE